MTAKDFARIYDTVSGYSPSHRISLDAVWAVLTARHWNLSVMDMNEWNEVIAAVSAATKVPQTDISSHLHDFIAALLAEGLILPSAIKETKSFTNRDAASTVMFRDYGDLADLLLQCVDKDGGTLPYEGYHWVFLYWTLVWMGVPFTTIRKLQKEDVVIDGSNITITHEDSTWSLISEQAVSFINYSLNARPEFRGSLAAADDMLSIKSLVRCRNNRVYRLCSEFSGAVEERTRRVLDSYMIQRCGIYWRAAVEMKAHGLSSPPKDSARLMQLLRMKEGVSQNTYRKWRNEFYGWYELYGRNV